MRRGKRGAGSSVLRARKEQKIMSVMSVNATGSNFSAQPTLGLQEVTTVQITWETAGSLCCALTYSAVYSLEMLLMAQKSSPCPCWKYQ